MDWITGLDSGWAYFLVFIVLYISGAGVPCPEEIPLAASGYFIAINKMSWVGVAIVVAAALMLGDLTAYWLGRRFGNDIWGIPPFRWVLTPKRFDAVKKRFQEHEGKAIFFGRFFAGVRLITFVFAGIVRVPVVKFVTLDFLAACASAPMFVIVAYFANKHFDFEHARAAVGRANLVLMAVVATGLVIAWTVWKLLPKRATTNP